MSNKQAWTSEGGASSTRIVLVRDIFGLTKLLLGLEPELQVSSGRPPRLLPKFLGTPPNATLGWFCDRPRAPL
jgi:hypothetical protein